MVNTKYIFMLTFGMRVMVPCNRPESPEGRRGIALLSLYLATRRGWVVSTTPRPLYPREGPGTHCTGGWWVPGPVWTCARNLVHTGIRSQDRQARSQSLYRLSYPAPIIWHTQYQYSIFNRNHAESLIKALAFSMLCFTYEKYVALIKHFHGVLSQKKSFWALY
jgi:hypothetical protein